MALQLVCPHCQAINRLPPERLGESPRCGRCPQALVQKQPLPLGRAAFETHLQHSGLPLLVDFWAPWCNPCLMMAPQFSQATAYLEPRVRCAKVDTQAEPELAARFNIRSIPTLALFANGVELARQPGAMGAADIVAWTTQQLAAHRS